MPQFFINYFHTFLTTKENMKHQTTLLLILFSVLIISNANAQTEYSERKLSFVISESFLPKHQTTNDVDNLMTENKTKMGSLGLLYTLITKEKYKIETGIKYQVLFINFTTNISDSEFPVDSKYFTDMLGSSVGNLFTVPLYIEKNISINNIFEITTKAGMNIHLLKNRYSDIYGTYEDPNKVDSTINNWNPNGAVVYLGASYPHSLSFSIGLSGGIGIKTKLNKVNFQLNLIGNFNLRNMSTSNYQIDELETINQKGQFIVKGHYIGTELIIIPKKKKK